MLPVITHKLNDRIKIKIKKNEQKILTFLNFNTRSITKDSAFTDSLKWIKVKGFV